MISRQLWVQVVDAEHWQGPFAAHAPEHTFIVPRILFDWKWSRVGMTVQRRQFPLRLAYAVTFNKSQGKTLDRAVVDLRGAPFAHGQLYVALSRVRSRQSIRVLCDAAQVRQGADGRCVVAQNVVERAQYIDSMPPHCRAAFEAAFPVPADEPAPVEDAAAADAPGGIDAMPGRGAAPGRGRGRGRGAAAPAAQGGAAGPAVAPPAQGRGRGRGRGRGAAAQAAPDGAAGAAAAPHVQNRGRGRGRGRAQGRAQGRGRDAAAVPAPQAPVPPPAYGRGRGRGAGRGRGHGRAGGRTRGAAIVAAVMAEHGAAIAAAQAALAEAAAQAVPAWEDDGAEPVNNDMAQYIF